MRFLNQNTTQNTAKTITVLSFGVLAVTILHSSLSYAYCEHRPGGVVYCPPDNDGAVGFLAGLEAALLTSYSILTTEDNQHYDSETLLIEAAAYQDTGIKGPVFQAFANQMVAQMGDSVGNADRDVVDAMIAQRILKDAK